MRAANDECLWGLVADHVVYLTVSAPCEEQLEIIRRQPLVAQVAYSTRGLQLEVDNGGSHQYFINNAGCLGYDCLFHLWLVGAPKISLLLESALKLVNRDSLSPKDFQDALHEGRAALSLGRRVL